MGRDEIVRRTAEIHGELIVIHPFRDGNGRTTRLLCDLLLIQSGRRVLDTTIFYDRSFITKYHSAIRMVWHSGDCSELERLLS
ncbi:Fic family protein [Solidesulfovibrio alcoholivorans]|uniref:Fic family protein n=1 Tax=Solidesulfovibrio alcoholivorans TaxID=81406 RepID=UPI00138E4A45|nr:Fic family protein [Solidesulfovibrio alcoholivorans]